MLFHVSSHSGVPLFRQIVEQVRTAVVSGALQPGDQLPPVRKLAAELVINPSTIAKAYAVLEQQGTVESRQGSGVYVLAPATPTRKAVRLQELRRQARALVVAAHHLRLQPQDVIEAVEAELRAVDVGDE